jgi:hypothetical protein
MESFSLSVPDVYWPSERRHKYPILKKVKVECKKRRALNIHAFFSEAVVKYGGGDKIIILASKLPRKGSLKKQIKKMQKAREAFLLKKLEKKGKHLSSKKKVRLEKRLRDKYKKQIKMAEKKLRARHDISALVTVELGFFAELFRLWLRKGHHDKR